jgi:hypothetical protein
LTSGNIQVHAAKKETSTSKDDDSDRDGERSKCSSDSAIHGDAPSSFVKEPTGGAVAPLLGPVFASPGPTGSTLSATAIQNHSVPTLVPAQTPGGGSKPAGKTGGLASLLAEPACDRMLFASLDETELALRTDLVGTFAADPGQMLDDGAYGFTFEELASRLRVVAMPDSTPVSTKVFDQDSGEFVDAEMLELRRWLEHGVVANVASAKVTANLRSGPADHAAAGKASAPVIDWTGSFPDSPAPRPGVST